MKHQDNAKEHVLKDSGRAEETLRFLQFAVKRSNDAVFLLRKDGRFTYVNDATCSGLGYSREELLSLTVHDIDPEFPAELWPEHWEDVKRRRSRTFQSRHRTKDGRVFPVDLTVDYFEYEGAEYNCAVARDITEQKLAEDALRKSEEKFRGIAERSFDAVFTSDHEGKFTYLSSAIERIFGYTSSEMVGRHFSEFLVEHELPRVLRLFGEAMQGRYTEVMSIEVVKKDGAHAHLEVGHSRILDEDGRPVGLQGLIRDVTERRRAEDALGKEQRLLRQLYELQERERQLISYEIHDGLTQHLFGAQMMLQGLKPLVETLPDDARQIYGQALRLLINGGKEARALISQLRPPILDESGILAAIDFLIAEQSDSAAVQIEFQHDGLFEDLAPALQAIVFRVVQEGLANACRHSHSEKVRVALARHNGAIRVEIRDWGRGFDPGKVKENRFGLEGIRERARLFGGKAAIETAPGKGTRVTVELPDVNNLPIGRGGRPLE